LGCLWCALFWCVGFFYFFFFFLVGGGVFFLLLFFVVGGVFRCVLWSLVRGPLVGFLCFFFWGGGFFVFFFFLLGWLRFFLVGEGGLWFSFFCLVVLLCDFYPSALLLPIFQNFVAISGYVSLHLRALSTKSTFLLNIAVADFIPSLSPLLIQIPPGSRSGAFRRVSRYHVL